MAVWLAGAIGCNAIVGANDFVIVDESPDRGSSEAGVIDTGEIDHDPPPDSEPPIVVDAAPYDAGEAGYTDISGSWDGAWNQDLTLVSGSATFELTQDGGTLSGTVEIKGGACPRMGTLHGAFTAANEIAGTFTSNDGVSVFNMNATVSADAKKLTGRFQSTGACSPGAFGAIILKRP